MIGWARTQLKQAIKRAALRGRIRYRTADRLIARLGLAND